MVTQLLNKINFSGTLVWLLSKNMNQNLPQLVVILGPTASGKTGWGIEIAKKFEADIISADSRQVYQRMDIGTAKPKGEWRWDGFGRSFFVQEVRHRLVDFLNPGKVYSAAEFRDQALKYAKIAQKHGRVPLVVGGTGLYISTLVDNFIIPRVAANSKLRKSLEEKTLEELTTLLETMDPKSAAVIDRHNRRRLVRALEVCIMSGEVFSEQRKMGTPLFDVLQIGIDVDREELRKRINDRIDQMMATGLLKEIEKLLQQKYSWTLGSMNGIGYRQFKGYFEGTESLENAVARFKADTWQYARRQLTWFRRDQRIRWVKTLEEAQVLIEDFLKKSNTESGTANKSEMSN